MYLISYDIPSDRIRTKIAKKLEDYGKRVQYSVFECRISEKQLTKLYGELTKLLQEQEGSIRIYVICANCEPKLRIIGTVDEGLLPVEEDLFII